MRAEPFHPAPRQGVAASRVRGGAGPWRDVLAFLQARFPQAPDWPERLQAGEVLDAHGAPLAAHSPCPPGCLIWYWRRPPPEARVPFEVDVLHRCERLLVVDKPPFLAVAPAGRHLQETVLLRLQQQFDLPELTPLHRLDRDTSGVLAFCIQAQHRTVYQALWRERRVEKDYEAIAPWSEALSVPLIARHRLVEPMGEGFHQMKVEAGEPNCETRIECLREVSPTTVPGASAHQRLALYGLNPITGRKHQLRAQMAALGLPIVNDRIYPVLQPDGPDDYARPLQLLARRLRFVDPLDGRERSFESRRCLGAPTALT